MINFFISSVCKPVVGSSKINIPFLLLFDLPRNKASLILCASPPERVEELWPSLTYPKPTSSRGLSFFNIFNSLFFLKKSIASCIVISRISWIFLFSYFTSSTSFLNLFPWQLSHFRCTSAINCISMVTSPSPLHFSHLPPSTLKEKCLLL